MIVDGDGSWQKRLQANICPKCQSQLSELNGGSVDCKNCKLSIRVEPCKCLGSADCPDCFGKGWN